MLVASIFSISHNVFKWLLSQGREKSVLYSKMMISIDLASINGSAVLVPCLSCRTSRDHPNELA